MAWALRTGLAEDRVLLALVYIGAYVALIGGVAFAEQFVARDLDPFHLDALLRLGALVLAVGALLAVRGFALPDGLATLGGLGIGVIAGAGSLCYCLALARLPGYLVACLANGYLVVTFLLGVVLLHEALTAQKVVGLLLIGAGAVLLAYRPHPRAASTPNADGPQWRARIGAFGWVGGYILLVGLSAFLEKPALAHLDALQLNAIVAVGMLAVGVLAVFMRDPRASRLWREPKPSLWAIGLGSAIGAASIFYYLGLARIPVSVAATLSESYVVVPVVLAFAVQRETFSWQTILGLVSVLAGAALLAFGPL